MIIKNSRVMNMHIYVCMYVCMYLCMFVYEKNERSISSRESTHVFYSTLKNGPVNMSDRER